MDSYGLSKVCNEKTARAFAMRYGADIYALRIGNVIEPHEYGRFPGFVADPPSRKRNAWSYIDARDLGEIVHLCLREGRARLPGLQCRQRHRSPLNMPTSDALNAAAPKTPVTREIGEYEAPLSNRKIREVLGFKEAHNWRQYAD